MFEQRFTERARKKVVRTQAKAYRLRHDYMDIEQPLLGPLHEEEGLAAQGLITSVSIDETRGPRR
jgi:ATP-dependent Clp protease ATP-binding subunit ClpC